MINNRNFESGTFSKKSGRYEKYIQIGIEVLGEHQKRIAKALTITFVTHCMKCDLVPHWDCVESNKDLNVKLMPQKLTMKLWVS